MKNVFYVILLIPLILVSFTACTLHVPYDWEWDSREYEIVLKVDPDDSQVLLNGKLIGYAYEFATWESALRLASRNNQLVIKREGFREEPINLYDFSSHRITIRLKMVEDRDYAGSVKPRAPRPVELTESVEPRDTGTREPGYQPKREQPKQEPPETTTFEEPAASAKSVNITLEIAPEESSIYLNGRFWGISPKSGIIENLRLKPGEYSLEVVKPGFRTYEKKLVVADQNLKLIIKLEKSQ